MLKKSLLKLQNDLEKNIQQTNEKEDKISQYKKVLINLEKTIKMREKFESQLVNKINQLEIRDGNYQEEFDSLVRDTEEIERKIILLSEEMKSTDKKIDFIQQNLQKLNNFKKHAILIPTFLNQLKEKNENHEKMFEKVNFVK